MTPGPLWSLGTARCLPGDWAGGEHSPEQQPRGGQPGRARPRLMVRPSPLSCCSSRSQSSQRQTGSVCPGQPLSGQVAACHQERDRKWT